MNIQITIGDQTFGATLQDSPAARDLLAQLPVTVEMVDHGGVERTGPLSGPLSLEGQPEGADPDGWTWATIPPATTSSCTTGTSPTSPASSSLAE